MCFKAAYGMTVLTLIRLNLNEQSDLDLHCLLRPSEMDKLKGGPCHFTD